MPPSLQAPVALLVFGSQGGLEQQQAADDAEARCFFRFLYGFVDGSRFEDAGAWSRFRGARLRPGR